MGGRLARLLVVDPVTRRSEFDRLKDVAKAASPSRFKQRLALLADIEAIRPTRVWLEGVPPKMTEKFAVASWDVWGGRFGRAPTSSITAK